MKLNQSEVRSTIYISAVKHIIAVMDSLPFIADNKRGLFDHAISIRETNL